ncbi:MAG: hypothetical protein RDA78_20475 [Roseibium sp.]|uniref:baeRF11 domain-containing protein n=1 Tax=Roseibium sp. TaxID=1936156 RepID=UPI003D9C119C
MHYVDIPTYSDIKKLARKRNPVSVSFTLRTTPVTQDAQQDRTKFSNLAHEAVQEVSDGRLTKSEISDLEANLADIVEDDDFWGRQYESLVVFATPESVRTYRLPNHLNDTIEISDRFHLTPLLRAVAFPHNAVALVLGQNDVRVIEINGDRPAGEIKVSGMPDDAASVAGKSSILGRAPKGRLQGSEGQKVHLLAYSRRVDAALRPLLAGRDIPLVLVAHKPMRSIFLSVCSYDNVLHGQPEGASEESSDADIASASRQLIDAHYEDQLKSVRETYAARVNDRRASDSVSEAGRLGTFGAVDTLLVNMETAVPGTIDAVTGEVAFSDSAGPDTYDVLSEIASRVIQTGGDVLSVRQNDLPGSTPLAALLRYPI